MRKAVWVGLLLWVVGLVVGVPSSYAGEVDLLIQKLVDKGVLSAGEGQELIVETREEVKKQTANGTNESIPAWVQSVKVKGDMRARYQFDAGKNSKNENRGRTRMRLGVEAKANDQMKVGIGLATGSTADPRSTNSTWGKATVSNTPAGTTSIILDYAYGQYTPMQGLKLTAGKFHNPLWQPNDLLWDGDLNPDGVALQLNHDLFPEMSVFLNSMAFVMYEDRNADYVDPVQFALQPGAKYKITDTISMQGAVAYYKNDKIKNRTAFASTASTNSRSTSGKYIYDYSAVQPTAEVKIKNPFGEGGIPMIAFSGDYVKNISMEKNNTGSDGWDAAVKFGDGKVGDKGQWQAKLSYARLGRDAFMDIFPDSDRYSGKTNMRGYEAILNYGLGKNTFLGLDYYWAESLAKSGTTTNPAQIMQVDWNLKF